MAPPPCSRAALAPFSDTPLHASASAEPSPVQLRHGGRRRAETEGAGAAGAQEEDDDLVIIEDSPGGAGAGPPAPVEQKIPLKLQASSAVRVGEAASMALTVFG